MFLMQKQGTHIKFIVSLTVEYINCNKKDVKEIEILGEHASCTSVQVA